MSDDDATFLELESVLKGAASRTSWLCYAAVLTSNDGEDGALVYIVNYPGKV